VVKEITRERAGKDLKEMAICVRPLIEGLNRKS